MQSVVYRKRSVFLFMVLVVALLGFAFSAQAAEMGTCVYLSAELLQNIGFEEADNEWPSRPAVWDARPDWGTAVLAANEARTGDLSAKLSGTGFIYQRLPVIGGGSYEFSAWAKGQGSSHAALKIEYWGGDGNYIGGEQSELRNSGDEWQQIVTYATMPNEARSVTLLLRTYDSEVYFDDASFKMVACTP